MIQTPKVEHDRWLAQLDKTQPRGLHVEWVPHNKRDDGFPALALGARIGYWPCLYGYFISFSIGPGSLHVWYGLPTKGKKK